jgi:IS605 OrfB family transposase
MVFCPKYRGKVLVGDVETRLKHILYARAQQYGVLIETMEVMPDQVHLLVTADPTRCVAEIVNRLKGLSSRLLRQEFRPKSVADVGWSSFLNMLAYKAESAGRQLVRVDPRGTSQRCPCGQPATKKLADRQHVCTCGLRTKRDHASSLEILRLGLSLQPLTAVQ